MNFNNLIAHLKIWCQNKAKAHEAVYGNYGGVTYVGYHVAYELEFKLSTLVDKHFENIGDIQRTILNLVDIHYEHSILNPANNVSEHIIEKTNKEFCEYLSELVSKIDNLTPIDLPYFRVIIDDDAKALSDKFRLIWKYDNTSYWFPLMGEEPKEISDKFFIMFDYLEPYMAQLQHLIGLPQTHIYSYGENAFRPEHCVETVELIEYGGCETIYTDKEFTWAIYFSHENTVAFVGSIVPRVKELLTAEKEHWDKFEWSDGAGY